MSKDILELLQDEINTLGTFGGQDAVAVGILQQAKARIETLEAALQPFAEKGWAAVCVAHEDRIKPLPKDTMLSVCATIAEVNTARAAQGRKDED